MTRAEAEQVNRSRSMSTGPAPAPRLRAAALASLALLALATRLPAPWRVEVINDEMYHIKSWRHMYGTDDVIPLFLRRLDATDRFSPDQKERLRRLYRASPLFQRLLCVKDDYGSIGFGALAEAIEALSGSSLTALRLPAVLFSLATIVVAYRLGKALGDEPLGLWLAAFFTVGLLPQVYAGLGRSHGMTQFALVALAYAFVLERRDRRPGPGRFLAVALFAQLGHLTGWGAVGILVAAELGRRYLAGAPLGALARQTWWYAALSLALFGAIVVASVGTSVIGANVYYPGLGTWWDNFCLASPLGHLAGLGRPWMRASGLVWAALILNGVRLLFADEAYRGVRWPFLVILGVSLSVPLVASSGVRHLMIYGVVPTILSAIGARAVFGTPRAATLGVLALVAALAPLSLSSRDRAYRFILPLETPYSRVADRLAREMAPGDVWISWPYFVAYPLYPYRALPEPILPLDGSEFHAALRSRPADRACFVLTVTGDEGSDPALGRATLRVEYPNGTVLLRLPPSGESARGRSDRAAELEAAAAR